MLKDEHKYNKKDKKKTKQETGNPKKKKRLGLIAIGHKSGAHYRPRTENKTKK